VVNYNIKEYAKFGKYQGYLGLFKLNYKRAEGF